MTYLARFLCALFARPLDPQEELQSAADHREAVSTGEEVLSGVLSKEFGKPVMVKALSESWLLVAAIGAPWGILTQHTMTDVHFSPEVRRDVILSLHASKRIPHHAARYRPPMIGRIS